MASSPNTRERIVQASLELFNAQGERSVTTNHIAAHLGISPGNLYYHVRNKQAIIAELFAQYEAQVDDFLQPPAGRALTVADKTFYLEALLAAMWRYRFLHRDLEHLLDSDAALAERYRLFARRCLGAARRLYQGFVDAGILSMTARQIEALALNAWIILTSWVRFLCTTGTEDGQLSEPMLRRGIYQVLALESGHVSEPACEAVEALQARLFVSLG
ncbi:TetR/AcrR family transcriptional regulator [Phytopseudomonas dryadis]|uniref:TetR family transcriptional regulator n=1 Tax=Phytopseudomonas dryadis TaxID=2487520 RepID=A0A4Q9R8B0_9GAMM|nr:MULTISPECIES: TetR/AcrR family transcriptional regulator [Pseudomonas]TBU96168.1 TetR family transcriptional regulator [Pseudomonas dryadis]TBV02830.1 TetR family transcriptional regulator [Pseudomonas dryadis]TBV15924.1 TetR family transcriptional regulator [Pseudomonas sp. FRB 230]